MRLALKVPPDASFLSSSLYEGVAYVVSITGGKVTPEYIELPDNALAEAFASLSEDDLSRLRIATALNDYRSVNNLLKSLGVKEGGFWPEKKKGGKAKIAPYGLLLSTIARVARERPEALTYTGTIDLSITLKGKEVMVGSGEPSLSLALFKSCDKYGSLRVWEFRSISEQVGQRLSIHAALLCLLGLASSYVGRTGNTNFFLFLDPTEVLDAINASVIRGEDPSLSISSRLSARNVGKDVIKEFLEAAVIPSAILSRLALSVKLIEAMNESNLETLRLRLVRVDEEGKIYKVYGDVPVDIRRHPLLSRELAKRLTDHVDPKKPLMMCVRRFVYGKQLCEESDHVIKAVDSLYRFVALADPIAISDYIRNLRDAVDVLEAVSAESPLARWRRETYLRWLAGLDYVITKAISG